ncbi:MAG: ABC transporter substrate-binding protein [Lachnospiraceae bacterium]|nr:ABC transporter substrate-binding protein [Lachnospiraceae bacterium]
MSVSKRTRKNILNKFLSVIFAVVLFMVSGCGSSDNEADNNGSAASAADFVTVGFSQLGAESDWRSANSRSMREAFSSDKGYELIFEDGQQKQSKQITAIRSFIQQGVDYIVLAPVTQDGWDSVLQETKEADIPVIIVDRMVDVANDDLFTCWVGSDFYLEGCKACEWLYQYTSDLGMKGEDIHIVNIQGTLGSSAQIGRSAGLNDYVEKYGWDLREETPGDFTQAKGREVMAQMLVTYNNINVVYCENDNEALGAIEAIEAAGLHAGGDIQNGDILVLSFDGVNENAINYCLEGTIACIVECNPLHGPRVENIIKTLEKGGSPDKLEYVSETLYSSYQSVNEVSVDGTTYPVTMLTQEVIDTRAY